MTSRVNDAYGKRIEPVLIIHRLCEVLCNLPDVLQWSPGEDFRAQQPRDWRAHAVSRRAVRRLNYGTSWNISCIHWCLVTSSDHLRRTPSVSSIHDQSYPRCCIQIWKHGRWSSDGSEYRNHWEHRLNSFRPDSVRCEPLGYQWNVRHVYRSRQAQRKIVWRSDANTIHSRANIREQRNHFPVWNQTFSVRWGYCARNQRWTAVL